MAVKTHPIFMSFSSGEISPKMEGRIDLDRYATGCNKMQNFFCTPQGGAQADPGSRYVATQGDESRKAILIPFVYSALQPYVIEAGHLYFRFFKDGGQIMSGLSAYEIVTPYKENDLPKLRWIATDFWLLLFHPDYAPRVLERASDTSWTLSLIDFYDGPYEDEVTDPTITPSATTGSITLTASDDLFLDGHVGAFWRIKHTTEWGHVVITAVTSSTVATATVIVDLDGSGTAAAAYQEGAWSEVNGWPAGACFYEGRMLCFGSYEWPNTVWASKTRHYDIFSPGTNDDDAYIFEASDVDVLRWAKSGKFLAMGAYSGEATAKGGGDVPITPTNPPMINTETNVGSANVDSIKAGRSIIYLQRAGKKVMEFSYDYASDAYQPNDLTILSDHLTEAGLTFLFYQAEPVPIVWGLRSDGVLVGCTFDKQQKIVGWHEHITDGEYESGCCVPTTDRDEVWVTVKRTINGVDKRFVEVWDPEISVHCGLTYSGVPVTTITLAHLVGETVAIVGDGAVYPSQVVPAGGVLTISPSASEIYAGLPYTPTLITNRPEIQIQGTSQGLKKRWNKIKVRVIDTSGITINGQITPVRTSDDEMDTVVPTTTGDIVVDNIGWDEDARVTITQPNPLPAYIVAVFGDLVTGDA
jgi:hypothetical protein